MAGEDYFGLPQIVSIILCIIPFTSWVCGLVTRLMEGKIVAAILRFFFGWLCWIIDLVLCIANRCHVKILRVIDV